MPGPETTSGACLVVCGKAGPAAREFARALDARLLVLGEVDDLEAALREVERSNTVWLHSWIRNAPTLAPLARRWFVDGPGPAHVARAPRVLVWGRGSISLGSGVVLSTPASCVVRGGQPVARAGVTQTELDYVLELEAPASLDAHLAAINEATSLAAELGQAAGERATWRGLLWRPVWIALRGLVSARGGRRAALPRVALEGFRETLTAIKLWERRCALPIAPPSLQA